MSTPEVKQDDRTVKESSVEIEKSKSDDEAMDEDEDENSMINQFEKDILQARSKQRKYFNLTGFWYYRIY